MDEYSTLAERVAAGVGDVHGCLILSRDGLVLGAYPDGDEGVAKPAWLSFAMLGESQRGFVEFGDQIWVFVNRGPYAAFAVAAASVRPALLMDRLEQALLTAEEARSRRESLQLPEVKPVPTSKPRTSLHPSPERIDAERPPAPAASPRAVADAGAGGAEPIMVPEPTAHLEADAVTERGADGDAPDAEPPTDQPLEEAPRPSEDEGSEVDRVLLAKEFSGLLQVNREGDEA